MRKTHTIQKTVSAKHAEDILNAHRMTEVNEWSQAELEQTIIKMETDALFDIRHNSLAAEKAWAFALFDETQERDATKYPKNYDLALVKSKKDAYITQCRTVLARLDKTGEGKLSTKDVNGDDFTLEFRIKRLIVDRKEMFEQFRLWERRNQRVNQPTLAIDNSDTPLKENENLSPYQSLLLHFLSSAYTEGYRRYGDFCCQQIRNTRAWRPVKEIKQYVYELTCKEDAPEMWLNLTSRSNVKSDVVRHMTDCVDFQFPEIVKDRHTWSFENGLLVGKDWSDEREYYEIKFYDYTSPEFRDLDPTLVSCKYFDLPFDPFTGVTDWWDIPTPNMQKILDYQRFDIDVSKWMYVMIGRLCFEVNDLDSWQVIPFLKGIARSGKSTIINHICKRFYETEDVAVLSNNIEKKFGLSSIHKGFMFISPEIKGDLQLEQAEFQSLVSGESVSIARKNESALSKQWKTPGILGGNEVPGFKDNSGSVLRRMATWNLGRQVTDADPHLEDKLEMEIPAIMCKCLKAYLDYAHKYSDKDIWNVLPPYFKKIQSQVATVTNVLYHFLCSPSVRYGRDLSIPQKVFVDYMNIHCSQNNLTKPRFNEDFYAGPFSSKELEVRVESRIYRDSNYSNQPHIFGIDIALPELAVN